jgi:HSP20 family protein
MRGVTALLPAHAATPYVGRRKEGTMTFLTRFNRFDPFEDLDTLKNQFDRFFARLNPELEEGTLNTPWIPAADIVETKDAIFIKTELPGLNEKDIKVEMDNGLLTIRGERKLEKETTEKGYRKIERSYGKFVRTFTLPPTVEFNKINAAYTNGLLELEIPKKEEAKPKTINIEVKKKLPAAA